MRRFPGMARLAVATAAFAMLIAAPAQAQKVPEAIIQEVLIKTSLLSLNDANVTGNYTVFHAKLSKAFRDQVSVGKLAEVFKEFRDKKIDYEIVVAKPPIAEQPPAVDDNGKLSLRGRFEVGQTNVRYDLAFVMSDGEWKLIKINVDVKNQKK